MARTGPQKIPGASQQYFYGRGVRYTGSAMEVNCGVAHTTEGMTLTTYNSGAMAPTVTGLPDIKAKRIRWWQHFDVDESARALENRGGGVETNTANVFQVELVGTCDANHAKTWGGKKAGVDYIYWPDAPDWALAEVAWLVRWLHDEHKIPLTCVTDWLAYGKDPRRPGVTPASYGANPARMSMAAWRKFTGWCGHQHVPENDHGDPGSMNFARVIALAKGTAGAHPDETTTTPATEEDPMPVAKVITESVPATDRLPAGEYTLIKMATDTAALQGPCTYVATAYATITGTPGTRVTARWHDLPLSTGRPSLDLPVDGGTIGPDGVLNLAVTRNGGLGNDEQLRIELRADTDATVTRRVLRALRTDA